MNALVILDRGALRVHRRTTGSMITLAPADAANRQPVWSADGRLIAWSRFDRRSSDGLAKVIVVDLDSPDERVELDVIFPAFYLHWRPDSAAIATLGEGPLGLELTVIDVVADQGVRWGRVVATLVDDRHATRVRTRQLDADVTRAHAEELGMGDR